MKRKCIDCQKVIARKRRRIEKKLEIISRILGKEPVFVQCSPENGKLKCIFTFGERSGEDIPG